MAISTAVFFSAKTGPTTPYTMAGLDFVLCYRLLGKRCPDRTYPRFPHHCAEEVSTADLLGSNKYVGNAAFHPFSRAF